MKISECALVEALDAGKGAVAKQNLKFCSATAPLYVIFGFYNGSVNNKDLQKFL